MKNFIKKLGITKAILLAVVLIVAIFAVKGLFFKKSATSFTIEKVVRGNITQEVSETGTVEAAEKVEMGFKTSGRVAQINVKVGDIVQSGAILARLEITQLYIQLNQAQASLSVTQVQHDKISQDTKNAAQQDLSDSYQDVLNTLEDAYLKAYNAYNAVISIQNSYFEANDQDGTKVKDNKLMIEENTNIIKIVLNSAKTTLNQNDIDNAISKTITSLQKISDALKIIREVCETGIYQSRVISADKTILDNQKSYIITALTNINNGQQSIASDRIAFQKAENEIDYYQTKVEEAQANVNYYQQQIWDAFLRTPIRGIVTKVDKKIGETVQTSETPISIISLDPCQIKVDIYEEDIVKIKKDNPVDIKVAALPNQIFKGKVTFVNPAEKIVDSVVYYEVTIAFNETNEQVKSGMTADLVIKTASKENVLVIPKEAINENGETAVQVYKNGQIETRIIQVGLLGNDNKIEVISGLSEDEEVVIK